LLQTDVRWTYLGGLAIRHGVGSLLYSTLTSKCQDQIPAGVLSVLRDRFAEEAQRNLTLSRVLLTVMETLNTHDLFAIPYKGPALACQVYGSIALRQFADLDLLVHPRDFDRARKLLVAMGYSLVSDRGWEIGLFALESGVRVNIDLHQAITPRRFHVQFDFDDLRERLENAVLLDTSLPVLSPSDLFLVISVHGSKPGERWSRLKWICDVSELLHHHSERIRWDWVLDTARERDAERMVMLGVNLAHELLDAPIPGEVRERMRTDSVVGSLTEWIIEESFCGTNRGHELAKRASFSYRVRRRWHHRVRYLLYLIQWIASPNEGDLAAVRLPRRLHGVYFIVRPVRVILNYTAARVARLLRALGLASDAPKRGGSPVDGDEA
jgi:hypothetical protein